MHCEHGRLLLVLLSTGGCVSSRARATGAFFPERTKRTDPSPPPLPSRPVSTPPTPYLPLSSTPYLPLSSRPGPLNPLSVEGFLDEGPEYVSGDLLEKWVTALPPDSPFAFVREMKLVNQMDFQNATIVYSSYTVGVPPFPDLFSFSTNYTSTHVGEPAASNFVVHGLSTCPLAQNCEESVERLASRAATGRPLPKVLSGVQ